MEAAIASMDRFIDAALSVIGGLGCDIARSASCPEEPQGDVITG
jgi:hypothetical protein